MRNKSKNVNTKKDKGGCKPGKGQISCKTETINKMTTESFLLKNYFTCKWIKLNQKTAG